MAFFYGVHIQEPELASALSLIRFLGEPDFFRPTHITIRGPYTRKIDETIEDIEKKFGAKKRFVELVGIGTFFEGNQNTVFLTCVIPDVEEIWKKPDYQGVKPHLTLYDGKSRHFAYKLKAALEKFSWHIKAEVSNLRRIESKQKPTEYLDIYFEDIAQLSLAIWGRVVDYKKLRYEKEDQRLVFITWVAAYIHQHFVSRLSA